MERAPLVVEATVHGRRLTRMDLARSWPDAERVRAPLKALDRLLGNRHLHAEREHMTRWLVRSKQPVIVIDWSDLKSDHSWHLLRAAIPVGGRTLPILHMVFPAGQQETSKAERRSLQRLADVLPSDSRPVLVTDTSFRGPWFEAVEAMGWQWLGRLRNTTYIKPVEVPDEPAQWVSCKAMYALLHVTSDRWRLRSAPLTARVVLHAKPPKGRKHRHRQGVPAHHSKTRKIAQRERAPTGDAVCATDANRVYGLPADGDVDAVWDRLSGTTLPNVATASGCTAY